MILATGCDRDADDPNRLAVQCINASGDNRVRHSASLAVDTQVTMQGNLVEIRVRVPVGISLSGRPKFKERTFRCRRDGNELRFVEAVFH